MFCTEHTDTFFPSSLIISAFNWCFRPLHLMELLINLGSFFSVLYSFYFLIALIGLYFIILLYLEDKHSFIKFLVILLKIIICILDLTKV